MADTRESQPRLDGYGMGRERWNTRRQKESSGGQPNGSADPGPVNSPSACAGPETAGSPIASCCPPQGPSGSMCRDSLCCRERHTHVADMGLAPLVRSQMPRDDQLGMTERVKGCGLGGVRAQGSMAWAVGERQTSMARHDKVAEMRVARVSGTCQPRARQTACFVCCLLSLPSSTSLLAKRRRRGRKAERL